MKPSDLNQDLITQTYNDLSEGAGKGYGKEWGKFPGDNKGTLPTELKKNIYSFSCAKTYTQLEAINKLLVTADGRLRTYQEFREGVRALNRQFNENYLRTEYNTARSAAQMAQKWQGFLEAQDLFPNLEFRTVGDDRVRPEHILLDGIIQPIESPFWKDHFPPLDWSCRCDVMNTAADPTPVNYDKLPKVNFKGNVAIDEEIFTKKATYFKLLNTDTNAVRNAELAKLNAPSEVAYKAGKKALTINIFADKTDLKQNIASSKVIVDNLKKNVNIRPHLDENIANGIKNPELLVDNKVADLKVNFKQDNYKGIKNGLKSAKKQGTSTVVFDLTNSFKNLDIVIVNRMIKGEVTNSTSKWLKEVIVIYNNRAIEVNRDDILQGVFLTELKKLKAN
ncbi:phage putative head morphogenesis protein, SPP1 gp7 family [Myroides sp. A21]|nr:phage putative head morphogenesis protein, SPP1 gp7 family [Myroides sp. A21]